MRNTSNITIKGLDKKMMPSVKKSKICKKGPPSSYQRNKIIFPLSPNLSKKIMTLLSNMVQIYNKLFWNMRPDRIKKTSLNGNKQFLVNSTSNQQMMTFLTRRRQLWRNYILMLRIRERRGTEGKVDRFIIVTVIILTLRSSLMKI